MVFYTEQRLPLHCNRKTIKTQKKKKKNPTSSQNLNFTVIPFCSPPPKSLSFSIYPPVSLYLHVSLPSFSLSPKETRGNPRIPIRRNARHPSIPSASPPLRSGLAPKISRQFAPAISAVGRPRPSIELGLGFIEEKSTHDRGCMEDNAGIPEDLRCKRSDGKQWRCNALSMPDKTVCEKHYYQAKKRAANSAMRASMKKAKKRYLDDGDTYLEGKGEEPEVSRSASPPAAPAGGGGEFSGSGVPVRKHKEKGPKNQGMYSPETTPVRGARGGSSRPNEESQRDVLQADVNQMRSAYNTPPSSKDAKNLSGIGTEEYSGRSSYSSEAEGLTCHQCRRNDRANVVWCSNCDQKGYCDSCIARWYAKISMEDIRDICPACRGICNCRVCFNADILIKAKIQEIATIDKLQYLHSLLGFVLPVLMKIYAEQCFEIGVETRLHGIKADIPRAKINADEQMCCDLCKTPIFDYHRHCTNCLYDLCLTCCRELRQASALSVKGESGECHVSERTRDIAAATMRPDSFEKKTNDKLMLYSTDQNAIDFSLLFPKWKANSDGSIPCGLEEAGGCGFSKLILRRILKINWAAKLVKNAEEMVSGCKIFDVDTSDRCGFCTGSTTSQASGSSELDICQCSHRDGSYDNFLYHPSLRDIKNEGISHFHKHWVKGEPIIVKHVFERSFASSWDPMSIWRGIQETVDERMKEDSVIVKAVNCFNQTEVDIDLAQFIKAYSEGCRNENGCPKMLKLKDWPRPSALEEFLSCQRPEFLSNLPLVEFIHFKWGVLNLAAKLPHDTLQTEVGPKLFIGYGTHEELGRGDSVATLQNNMVDLVYLLMHTADVDSQGWQRSRTEKSENISCVSDAKRSNWNAHLASCNTKLGERMRSPDLVLKELTKQEEYGSGLNSKDVHILGNQVCNGSVTDVPEKGRAGAIWDVFRRQDVPKLNEYLRVHWKEFENSASRPVNSAMCPIYDQALFLNKDHKRKLKEELRIEPWTFEQHIGEAVFVPAGCPFQVRNLQPSVQLSLDFLSPESLGESARMAHEIRSLPNDHDAKLKMLEVGKMSLYAASSAIREIQKITLDPRSSLDSRFEDRNLTAMVSENLERITKRRQIACS